MAVRDLYSSHSLPYNDITEAATQRIMTDRGCRKGQEMWNISLETGSRRELVGVVANSRVRYGEAWRCLDPAGIPDRAWYRMPTTYYYVF